MPYSSTDIHECVTAMVKRMSTLEKKLAASKNKSKAVGGGMKTIRKTITINEFKNINPIGIPGTIDSVMSPSI